MVPRFRNCQNRPSCTVGSLIVKQQWGAVGGKWWLGSAVGNDDRDQGKWLCLLSVLEPFVDRGVERVRQAAIETNNGRWLRWEFVTDLTVNIFNQLLRPDIMLSGQDHRLDTRHSRPTGSISVDLYFHTGHKKTGAVSNVLVK